MSLFAVLAKFVKFADLTIRSIRAAIQLLQFAVAIAAAVFHMSRRGRTYAAI